MDNSSPERCLRCRQQEAERRQQESECYTVTYRQPPTYNHQTTNYYQILSERGRHCLCMYITALPLLAASFIGHFRVKVSVMVRLPIGLNWATLSSRVLKVAPPNQEMKYF